MPDRARHSNDGSIRKANHNPHHLPAKTCPVCGREFTWRKKWERDWENVRYCSDHCRKQASSRPSASHPDTSAPR